jgi:hypothetical protein
LTVFRERLLEAYISGRFLDEIHACSLERENGDALVADLAALHNEGRIDAVVEFGKLESRPLAERSFFPTRHVFENALPRLNANVPALMRCVRTICARRALCR